MKNILLWMIHASGETTLVETNACSLDEINLEIPSGVYTTFRTFEKTKVLQLELHFERLEKSAEILGHQLSCNRILLRQAIREILLGLPDQDYRIRLSVDLETGEKKFYLALEPLKPIPAIIYKKGVKIVLIFDLLRDTPQAKTTTFIRKADVVRHQLPPEVNEALMTDPKGSILEGLSSNFFAVKNGKLVTAGEGILEGITRELVLKSANLLRVEIIFRNVHIDELASCEECFITSTSRGVLPVVEISETVIGNGMPGPVTRAIQDHFQQLIEIETEQI